MKGGGGGRLGGDGGLLTCKNAVDLADNIAGFALAKIILNIANATTIKNLLNFMLIG